MQIFDHQVIVRPKQLFQGHFYGVPQAWPLQQAAQLPIDPVALKKVAELQLFQDQAPQLVWQVQTPLPAIRPTEVTCIAANPEK